MTFTPKNWQDYALGATPIDAAALEDMESRLAAYTDAVNAAPIASTTQAADYTLALVDSGSVVEATKATAQSVTVPPNASVPFPVGTILEVCQMGAGQVTIVPGAGVTLRTASSLLVRVQYASAFLRKRATNEWVVGGDLV